MKIPGFSRSKNEPEEVNRKAFRYGVSDEEIAESYPDMMTADEKEREFIRSIFMEDVQKSVVKSRIAVVILAIFAAGMIMSRQVEAYTAYIPFIDSGAPQMFMSSHLIALMGILGLLVVCVCLYQALSWIGDREFSVANGFMMMVVAVAAIVYVSLGDSISIVHANISIMECVSDIDENTIALLGESSTGMAPITGESEAHLVIDGRGVLSILDDGGTISCQ